jgi:UDP:flavonoid glycosyltransferase YjiC (YdhE family)
VFLSHAGMNSVMESLLNQVPLATYPQTAEQSTNADRVTELGLGRRLPNDVTADLLLATVDELAADAVIRTNLAAMADHIHAAGGAPGAADALESYLTRPTQPPDGSRPGVTLDGVRGADSRDG